MPARLQATSRSPLPKASLETTPLPRRPPVRITDLTRIAMLTPGRSFYPKRPVMYDSVSAKWGLLKIAVVGPYSIRRPR